jgi:hypothetical protein
MKFTLSLRILALAAMVCGFSANLSLAVPVTLSNGNSTATFHTEAADAGEIGLNQWLVDDVNHMFQQWFWYRTGSQTREWAIDGTGPLAHQSTTSFDLDSDSFDEVAIARYSDTETAITPEMFSIELKYDLIGGTTGSNMANMGENIRIRNLGTAPLDLHLFQYVDFDLNDDTVDQLVLSGTPINTATQSDDINVIGETVLTPPPQRWEVGIFSATRDKLEDGDLDNLDMSVGPIAAVDATWAFQWDFTDGLRIPVGGAAIISKSKSIRPGDGGIIPEPSSVALVSMGAIGFVAAVLRRRRNAKTASPC